ncbi:MAG: hypothetical protein LBH58_13495 [Tannerellaceae bacterium]|jgi:hypothetical protein|nr:hypothetical protein [Tannerellaceae bacterium]
MKAITVYLLRFALAATVLTIIFRYFLSQGIDAGSTITVILSAVLYFIGMFILGWYFGKKDGNYLPFYDVGFRFHLTTYIIYNLISELWFILEFNSHYENFFTIHRTVFIWGGFLLIHFIFFLWARKRTINNLNKRDLFE